MVRTGSTDPGPTVATETRGAVAIAHLNRSETQNALVPELIDPLTELVAQWDADDAVRCIVIAGSQKVFASGADAAVAQHGMTDPAADLWPRLAAVQTPLVAAVSGFALGAGWELALACDMVVAGDNAEFGHPEIQLGLIPGGGGTQHLARGLGKQRAMELVLTGKRITAQEALEAGLVNSVTGSNDWFESACELALVVATRPPIAAQLAKQAILAAEETGLGAGRDEERRLRAAATATEDHAEGVQAFSERRRPEFKGR
jgi:enoyl-CoA hydratase/carnithine racemase